MNQIGEKISKEARETKEALRERTITLILGGFGLVAALAWNEAIRALFSHFFEPAGEILGKFIYAIVVTIIVVVISVELQKINKKE